MFGAICAGHPGTSPSPSPTKHQLNHSSAVQTNMQTLSPTSSTFLLPSSPPFHHLVVFLLPDINLPPDTGAAVYIRFPSTLTSTSTSSASPFTYLGYISSRKPSAIFKINRPTTTNTRAPAPDEDSMIDTSIDPFISSEPITLGISLEALPSLVSRPTTTPAATLSNAVTSSTALVPLKATLSQDSFDAATTVDLARRIIEDAFHYLASFSLMPEDVGRGAALGKGEVVPLRAFRDWWARFEGRVRGDPGFLARGQGG